MCVYIYIYIHTYIAGREETTAAGAQMSLSITALSQQYTILCYNMIQYAIL